MRTLAVILGLVTVRAASAETVEVDLSEALRFEHQIDQASELGVIVRITPRWWIGASYGRGAATLPDPAGSGQGDTSLTGGRARVRYLTPCGDVGCVGFDGGIGYQRVRMAFLDGLLMPSHWVERDDSVFVEARCVARIAPVHLHASLELSLGPSLHRSVYVEGGGFSIGVVVGIAIAGTI